MNTENRRAPKRHFTSAGGIFGSLPITWEANDADQWANPKQIVRLCEIVEALVSLGVEGLRMPEINPLRGLFISFWPHQQGTIAGDYFAELFSETQSGGLLPEVSDAITEVTSRYKRAGRTFPEARS